MYVQFVHDIMDQKGILDVIFVALPELDQCVISNLLGKLGELGVETADDMKLLEESDLKTTLKPIQIRKLLRKTGIHVYFRPNLSCSINPCPAE